MSASIHDDSSAIAFPPPNVNVKSFQKNNVLVPLFGLIVSTYERQSVDKTRRRDGQKAG